MADPILARSLSHLGTGLALPPAPDADAVAVAVLERLAVEPAPSRRRRLRTWVVVRLSRVWRWLVGGLVILAVTLAAVPPVRAQVSEWFSFLGVVVRPPAAGPAPTGVPHPPPVSPGLTVEQAAALVDFAVAVPRELGTPSGVEVSADRRLVSLSWETPTGTVRLDQFDGAWDPVFSKTARDATFVTVGSAFGLWFPTPHEVVVLDDPTTDRRRTLPPRLAAQTLVWQVRGTTLRLEGAFTEDRAVQIAISAT